MFEDINRQLQDHSDTVVFRGKDGPEQRAPRIERFRTLMQAPLALLRTDAFNQVESAVKRNFLRQLALDPTKDSDKIDLYFAPIDSFDWCLNESFVHPAAPPHRCP
jgi:hypothetical protein